MDFSDLDGLVLQIFLKLIGLYIEYGPGAIRHEIVPVVPDWTDSVVHTTLGGGFGELDELLTVPLEVF